MRLCQQLGIVTVSEVGTVDDLFAALPDTLVGYERKTSSSRFLPDSERIAPSGWLIDAIGEHNVDRDLRVLAGSEASDLGYTQAIFDRLLQTATFLLRNIT